ncbi:hypothetical protein ACFSJY_18565 [Thalassotalea euphylliae]|uniref:hypothetical protein n=1 Tax=Thalassotalea euphylliae TaxID=1655234 RepID=UPI0036404A6C
MDLDTHLAKLEKQNRDLFGPAHLFAIIVICAAVTITLVVTVDPVFGLSSACFLLFTSHYFYSQYAIKKLNNRITLLQTKLEQRDN